jgi:hypothetical protein
MNCKGKVSYAHARATDFRIATIVVVDLHPHNCTIIFQRATQIYISTLNCLFHMSLANSCTAKYKNERLGGYLTSYKCFFITCNVWAWDATGTHPIQSTQTSRDVSYVFLIVSISLPLKAAAWPRPVVFSRWPPNLYLQPSSYELQWKKERQAGHPSIIHNSFLSSRGLVPLCVT